MNGFSRNILRGYAHIPGIWILGLILFFLVLLPQGTADAASITKGAQRYVLENGLTVILKEDPAVPVTAIQVWVKTGSANETAAEAGITHLIEHMIFKGTPDLEKGEIARRIESSGGRINAYTSYDRTVYFVEIPGDHFGTGLRGLLDAVHHAVFDPEELRREKEVVLEEYRRSLDLPERQLGWDLMGLAYNKHPYGRPIIGRESTIRAIDRDMILHYMDKWYTPENMVVVAVGDMDAQKALEEIKDLTKDFPREDGHKRERPVEPPQHKLRCS